MAWIVYDRSRINMELIYSYRPDKEGDQYQIVFYTTTNEYIKWLFNSIENRDRMLKALDYRFAVETSDFLLKELVNVD